MNTRLKDPGSAITHLIAMGGAVICSFPLIFKATRSDSSVAVFSMAVFIGSMILLYGASSLYHSLDISAKVNLLFRRIDHAHYPGMADEDHTGAELHSDLRSCRFRG